MDDRELYQTIYDQDATYGNAQVGRCPGVRFIPQYKAHLRNPVVDLGCGRGHTVTALRKLGFDVIGFDMVDAADGTSGIHVADITAPLERQLLGAKTVICMDVIEHILDEPLQGLFDNFRRVPYQVFSIHNGVSKYKGKGARSGEDLHVNKKPFPVWVEFIQKQGLVIEKEIATAKYNHLYLTRTKA